VVGDNLRNASREEGFSVVRSHGKLPSSLQFHLPHVISSLRLAVGNGV
jgi:hypothetical protein